MLEIRKSLPNKHPDYEKHRENVIKALTKIGYKVRVGTNKDLSKPNCSALILRESDLR